MKQAQQKISLSEVEELEKLLFLQEKMEKVRVSFLLPKQLILLMDKIAQGQSRSKLVLKAILKEVKEQKKIKMEKKKEKLAQEYQLRTKEDKKVAQDWFSLEEEAWETWEKQK